MSFDVDTDAVVHRQGKAGHRSCSDLFEPKPTLIEICTYYVGGVVLVGEDNTHMTITG